MSYDFSGAVEVPMGDIKKALHNFTEAKDSEEKELSLHYYYLLSREATPENPFFGRANSREENLSIRILGHKTKEDNYHRKLVSMTDLGTMVGGENHKYPTAYIEAKFGKGLRIHFIDNMWDGSRGVHIEYIPAGLKDLDYPKAKTALLNPQQARFVKEFK